MTNNQLTDEQIAQLLGDACMVIGDRFATVDELSAAKAIRALAVELQERRKPLKDKDLQGVIDALEHPAGINAAGKQVVRLSLVELQERRKADSEPVGWTDEEELRDVEKSGCGYLFKANPITPHADPRRVILLYRHAQPAPDGYVMVPMRLTAENGAKGALSGEFSETKFVNCPECFGDDECETCDGSGRIEITVPVTWTTIKAIWVKGVEHFAATAQENN
ncbi:hypothetical protein D3C80_125500 [compost metagenome]